MANSNIGQILKNVVLDFTPGTKAKADEVNKNFDEVQKHVDTILSLGWHRFVDTAGSELAASYEASNKISVPDDQTTIFTRGMYIRIEQNTGGTKHFILRKVEYDSANSKTNLTLDGVLGAVLANESIDNPVYSTGQNPYGLPDSKERQLERAKGWSRLTDNEGNLVDVQFVSSNAPKYKVETTTSVDITDVISLDMKFRLEQSTGGTKYGTIVTSPTVNGNGRTEFEILSTSTIANETINNSVYSTSSTPHGWNEPTLGADLEITSTKSISASTVTTVDWDNSTFDPYGIASTANDEFTVPIDGNYTLSFGFGLEDIGQESRVIFRPLINGSTFNGMETFRGFDAVANGTSRDVNLNAGDKIKFEVFHTDSDAATLVNQSSNGNRETFATVVYRGPIFI